MESRCESTSILQWKLNTSQECAQPLDSSVGQTALLEVEWKAAFLRISSWCQCPAQAFHCWQQCGALAWGEGISQKVICWWQSPSGYLGQWGRCTGKIPLLWGPSYELTSHFSLYCCLSLFLSLFPFFFLPIIVFILKASPPWVSQSINKPAM